MQGCGAGVGYNAACSRRAGGQQLQPTGTALRVACGTGYRLLIGSFDSSVLSTSSCDNKVDRAQLKQGR